MLRFKNRIIISLFVLIAHCGVLQDLGLVKDRDHDRKLQLYTWLTALALLQGVGDYMAKMYYFHPLLAGNPTNPLYVGEAARGEVNPARKKLILVHGWHADDRDPAFIPLRSVDELKGRVMAENWSAFAATPQYAQILAKGYDIYAFDYLTSQGIDANGRRLRARMDDLFSGESGTVYIYAHSMGGLVTRFALYEGGHPPYLAKIITTGTPYHGSPWSSSQFLGNLGVLGSLASFVTDTTGGQDLRWDNYDGALSGSSNPKLDSINALTSRDFLVHVMYGSITGTSTAAGAGATLVPACAFLSSFGTSDCIVPSGSATLSGHAMGSTTDLGDYTHNDVKMLIAAIRDTLVAALP